MSGTLISIAGVDNKMEKILATRANIKSLRRFCDETRTPEERSALAEKTKLPIGTITHWAVQAELLRMETMSYDMAYEFVEAGIYSVEEIQTSDASEILKKLKAANPKTKITEDVILKLKDAKVDTARDFVCTKPVLGEVIVTKDTTPSIYSNLSNVIAELGAGVAYAQRAMDEASMDIQNEILHDDRLYGMGLQATWYVMPEVEFTMKMDYSVYEKKTESGTITGSKISVLPSNATYSNLFKSSKKEESSVRLRIVPIPANDKFLKRRYMADLSSVGTMGDLKSELERIGISTYNITPDETSGWGDSTKIRVLSQNPEKNVLLNLGVVPEINVEKI